MKQTKLFFSLCVFLLIVSLRVYSVAKVPAGPGPANWSTASSWSPAGVPTTADDVTITAGTIITFSSAVKCRALTVNGTLRGLGASGVLSIYGAYTLNGVEDGTNSTLAFFGTGSPAIQGSGTFNTLFTWSFNASRTIQSSVNSGSRTGLTKIYGGVTVTNYGDVTLNTTSLFNTSGGSRWTNAAGSTLTLKNINFFSGTTLNYGVFTANAVGNTVNINYAAGNIPNAVSGYYNLTFNSTSTGIKYIPANTTVLNQLTIASLNTLDITSFTLTVGGNWINSGTFSEGTGTVNFNGTSVISGSSVNSFYNLTISGTLTAPSSSNINVLRNWVNNGTFTHNSGTVTFSGTTVISGASINSFSNVTITGTLTAPSANMNVAGNWINNGTFTHNSGTVTFNGTSTVSGSATTSFGNVTISGTLTGQATNMNVAGNWINNGTFTHNNGRVTFNGTTTVSGSSTTGFADVTVSGVLTGHATNMNVAGNWINNGTFTHNNGTVTFNGTSTVSGSSTSSFKNLTITGTLTGHATAMNIAGNLINNGTYNHNNSTVTFNGTTTVSGTSTTTFNNVSISGTLNAHTSDMYVVGNWSNNGTFGHNNGTVSFNGTTSVTGTSSSTFNNIAINGTLTSHPVAMNINGNWINAGTFNHNNSDITFTGSTIVSGSSTTAFNNITISGVLTGHSSVMNIEGNFSNTGTYNSNSGLLVFNGAIPQTISGSGTGTFESLTLSNASGLSINNGTYNLEGTLSITAGIFTRNGGTFTLVSDASRYARIAPISSGCGSCGFSGNFVVQRYVPSRTFGTWANLSSPVLNATMAEWDTQLFLVYPFAGFDTKTNRPKGTNVMAYDEPSANYYELNASTPLTPAQGFEIGLTDDGTNTSFATTTLTATGTPNYGTFNIPLSYTAANGPAYPVGYSGENLIGNPYASAITLSDITITNALSTVDVYDYTIDNYKTLSGSDIIGPYQGFWAYAQGSGASFTILETSKSTNTSTALHRITNDSEQPYLNLMLSCADGSHTMAHTLKIACDASAKDGWDAEDHPFRRSLNPKAPNITAAVGQMNLSISTFNNDHETYLMPLDLQVGIDGMYQLNRSGMSAVTKDFATVILEDKFMKKFIDLSSSSNYTFFARTTDAKQRFVLHFSKSSDYKPAPSSIENNYENAVKIFQTLNGNMVSFNFSQTENAAISVMDLLGKNIIEKQYVNASNQNITIYLPDNFHGMYLISVESASGSIVKKFIAP